ncbi:MAG: helix-turn-helix transcriptional regulator [Gammaproteobacteria bacterium]|nr:helix-turn-helix transcriptional regulator [Gammaproteobacteria bacterium]
MSADFAFLVIDAFAVLAMVLIGVQYLWLLPANRNAQLLGLLCLAAVSHIVLGRFQYGYWISEPFQIALPTVAESVLNVLRNTAPGVFLFLSHSMLRDGKRLPKTLLVLFFVQLILEEPIHLLVSPGFPAEWLLTEFTPTLLQSLFLGWGIFWIVAEWRSDLIEARRGVRLVFLLVFGVTMLMAGWLQRVVVPVSEIENYYVHMFLIAVYTLLVCVVLVRTLARDSAHLLEIPAANPGTAMGDLASRDAQSRRPAARGDAESPRMVEALQRLLNVERVYRRPKISIRSLADEIGLPEYRLRRLIHEELGFRNFNAFMHHYRIREACEMLSDPDQARTPILTIALTVGYQSINTFNRAFRETLSETPSTFRARALESPDD